MAYDTPITLLEDRAANSPRGIHSTSPEFPDGLSFDDMLTYVLHIAAVMERDLSQVLEKGASVAMVDRSSVSYFVHILALIKAGYVPVLLSINLPAVSIAQMVDKAELKVIYGSEASAHLMPATMAKKHIADLTTVLATRPPDWQPSERAIDKQRVYMKLHSSGTTGLPKIIGIKVSSLGIHTDPNPSGLGGIPLRSWVFSPLSHIIGFSASCTPFDPKLNAVQHYFDMRTPFHAGQWIKACKERHFNLGTLPPSVMCDIANTPGGVDAFKGFVQLRTGGAPLPIPVGNSLVAAGVPLCTLFGATETGLTMSSITNCFQEWNWLRQNPVVPYELVEVTPGFFEIIVRCQDNWEPNVVLDIAGQPGYNSKDVFRRHPIDPMLFQHAGRNDNVIVLRNAYNVAAGAIDQALQNLDEITDAAIFGQGEVSIGVLLRLTDQPPVDTPEQIDALRELIFPAVESVNKLFPHYARIEKHMIVFATPDKPPMRTDKGTVRKAATLALYESEIEACYEAAETSVNANQLKSLDNGDIRDFVAAVVRQYVGHDIANDADIFVEGGLDSLRAIVIRNTLSANLKSLGQSDKADMIPTGLVYEYPTIAKLTTKFGEICSGSADDRVGRVNNFITQLIAAAPIPGPKVFDSGRPKKNSTTVLVTGTTGSLGSFILDILLRVASVNRIFCINRPSKTGPLTVQKARFEQYGISTDRDWSKVVFGSIEHDDNAHTFTQTTGHDLAKEVDHYILNAWPVHWLLALDGFKDILLDVAWLLATAARGDAHVLFVSSIAAISNYSISPTGAQSKHSGIPEQHFDNPLVSLRSGYGESKFCGEQLAKHYSEVYKLKTSVVRVGQISGDSRPEGNGLWATAENIPLLVKTSKAVRTVPKLGQSPGWTPVNQVAQILRDIVATRDSETTQQLAQVFHLSSPHQLNTTILATTIADFIDKLPALKDNDGVKIVPVQEWSKAVRNYAGPAEDVPAIKILQHFQSLANAPAVDHEKGQPNGRVGPNVVSTDCGGLSLRNTLAASRTLREEVGPIDGALIRKYLAYWHSIGFI